MSVKDMPHPTVASLIADYQAGAGAKKLAKRYHVCRETVECLLRKHGVPIRARGGVPGLRERPPEMIQALCADYRAGTGTVKLGKAYQLHPDTVVKILRDNGVEIRPARWPGAHKAPPVGATFGGSTVVGPADIPFTLDVNGQRVYRVRVECWSCKTRRDVVVAALRRGASRLCLTCTRQASRVGGVYE